MSGDLNPQQFEQLRMFMPTDEIINDVHKLDAIGPLADRSPAEQWYGHEESFSGGLAWDKQEGLDDVRYGDDIDVDWDDDDAAEWDRTRREVFDDQRSRQALEPLPLAKGIHPSVAGKTFLMDGHHRLAYAEEQGISILPVTHEEA